MDALSILRLPPVMAAIALAGQRLLTRGSATTATSTVVGAAVAAAGIGAAAGGNREIRLAGTTLDPLNPTTASRLVTGGIYQVTRNPMYLGVGLVLLGYGIHRRNPLALLPVAGFAAAMDRVQIPAEERALADVFGTDYVEYVAAVRRWL